MSLKFGTVPSASAGAAALICAQAGILRIDHAQPLHRRLGHRQRHHAAIDLLLRNAHQHGEIARAVVRLLQRLARLFHIGQGFLFAEMRIHRLLDQGDRQQRCAFHPVFEYIETWLPAARAPPCFGCFRNRRRGFLRLRRHPIRSGPSQPAAPTPSTLLFIVHHICKTSTQTRPMLSPADLRRTLIKKAKGTAPKGCPDSAAAGGIAPPAISTRNYWPIGLAGVAERVPLDTLVPVTPASRGDEQARQVGDARGCPASC